MGFWSSEASLHEILRAMAFTLSFLKSFFLSAYLISPVICLLLAVIIGLGQLVGRFEHWSRSDALYYAFITATTVGYGDFRPSHRRSKLTAIAIALTGILLTGIVVAIGLKALESAFLEHHNVEELRAKFNE